MNRTILFILITVLHAKLIAQENIKSFSLEEAVSFAVNNNLQAKNASLDYKNTRYRAWEIKSMGLPKLDASFDYNYYYLTPVQQGASNLFSGGLFTDLFTSVAKTDPAFGLKLLAQQYNTSTARPQSFFLPHNATLGATLSQLIFDGRYMVGLKAIKDLTLTQSLLKDKTEDDIRYNVKKAYFQAVAANSGGSDLQDLSKLLDNLLFQTKATYKEGLIEELDVNRLELLRTQLDYQINLQDKLSKIALTNLKFNMGLSVNETIVLKDKLEPLSNQAMQIGTEGFDVKNRIEYQLLEKTITLKNHDVRQKTMGYTPTLVGFVNFGYNGQTDKFKYLFTNKKETLPAQFGYPETVKTTKTWYSQGLIGIKLSIPIFDSGTKWAIINSAKIEVEKATNDLENFKNAAELQVQVARTNYESAKEESLNAKRSLELSEKIFKKNQIKFREGIGNSFELAQANQDYIMNRLKQVQSLLNVLTTKADLDKALGVK